MNKQTDYEIPVSKNTIDRMVDSILKENERLEQENRKLTEQLGEGQNVSDNPENITKAINEAIEKYL